MPEDLSVVELSQPKDSKTNTKEESGNNTSLSLSYSSITRSLLWDGVKRTERNIGSEEIPGEPTGENKDISESPCTKTISESPPTVLGEYPSSTDFLSLRIKYKKE